MKIVHAMSYLDDDLIAGAAEPPRRKNSKVIWGVLAACLVLAVCAAVLSLPGLHKGPAVAEGTHGKYKMVQPAETARVWPWAYSTVGEKYPTVDFEGTEYSIRWYRPVGEDELGELLGTTEAKGTDPDTGDAHSETVEIRAVPGASVNKMILAGRDGECYVYRFDDGPIDITLGDAMELYGLPENLRFTGFQIEGLEGKYFQLPEGDGEIWEILSDCQDSMLTVDEDSYPASGDGTVQFTVSAEVLGIYKRVFYVSEDGTVSTNILDYGYTCKISPEDAQRIIHYAKESGVETDEVSYEHYVIGVVVECGEDYLLVDDTSICINPQDGQVYRIDAEDLRMQRNLVCGAVQEGDIVVVSYEGEISEDLEIRDAYDMQKGFLMEDGGVAVPE